MRAYKIIYRLDYPTSFAMLDRLGDTAAFLAQRTKSGPFEGSQTSVSTVEHSISCKAMLPNIDEHSTDDDGFKLAHTVKTLNAVIEHKNGFDVSQLHNHPAVLLTDDVLGHLDFGETRAFERVGLRLFIIETSSKLKFAEIRDRMLARLDSFDAALVANGFEQTLDVGVIFESQDKEGNFVRLRTGPYQESEKERFFGLDVDVKEGMIADIDLWQTKLEIPSFGLSAVVGRLSKLASATVEDIKDRLEKELS